MYKVISRLFCSCRAKLFFRRKVNVNQTPKIGLKFKDPRSGTIAKVIKLHPTNQPSQSTRFAPAFSANSSPDDRRASSATHAAHSNHSPSNHSAQADPHQEKAENPLLTKIKKMLTQSDPDKWERAGGELNPAAKQAKPYESWNSVYSMSLPNGVLAVRCALPVKSQYFGGGYTVTPTGRPAYYVELRPRAWDARTLVDPYFRVTLDKDKQVNVLADGDIAETVYKLVTQTLQSFSGARKGEFNAQVAALSATLIDRVEAGKAEDWTKDDSDPTKIAFAATFDTLTVQVTKQISDEKNPSFQLSYQHEEMISKASDAALAKNIFELVDDKCRTASLLALSKVLESAGF